MEQPPTELQSPPARAVHATAWRDGTSWFVLMFVTVLGLVADLVSKELAFRHVASIPAEISREDVMRGPPLGRLIPPHEPVVVVPKLLEFTLVLNPGAVFGIGAGKRWFFVAFTAAAIAFAFWMFAKWTTPRDRWAHAAVGLLLAGGLGNLYDRLLYACVRDFIHPLPGVNLPFGLSYPWASGVGAREIWPYVSNVADLLLIIGIAALVIHTWRSGLQHSAASAANAAGDTPAVRVICPTRPCADMLLRADSITCGYDERKPVLRELSATFKPGTLTAIIGPNGAGKTTLLRALLGVLAPSAGHVALGDTNLSDMPASRRARAIVYVPQRSSLAFAYTARAVVAMGLYAEGASLDQITVDAALERVGLTDIADTPFATLSAGQQQRVTFARALAQLSLPQVRGIAAAAPRVLLADEPVASMDPRHALSTMATLRDLARQGLAVAVAMHDLSSVLRDADQTLVLGSVGTVLAEGPTSAVLTPEVLIAAFGVPFRAIESGGRTVALLPEHPHASS